MAAGAPLASTFAGPSGPNPVGAEAQVPVGRLQLEVLRGALLRRDELVGLLLRMSPARSRTAVVGALVRLAVPGVTRLAGVLAEVTGLEVSPPYEVRRGAGSCSLSWLLCCRRGQSERFAKVSNVSNQDTTESEFDLWKRQLERNGVDDQYSIDRLKLSAAKIVAARKYTGDNPDQSATRIRGLSKCANLPDISQPTDSGLTPICLAPVGQARAVQPASGVPDIDLSTSVLHGMEGSGLLETSPGGPPPESVVVSAAGTFNLERHQADEDPVEDSPAEDGEARPPSATARLLAAHRGMNLLARLRPLLTDARAA